MVSLNLHRRHLDESQRAKVAAKLANLSHGQRADHARDANSHISEPVTRARARAAELLNVSTRTVAAASKVKDSGAPERRRRLSLFRNKARNR